MELTVAEKVKVLAKRQGVTIGSLAARTGQSSENLFNKLRRDDFTVSQICSLADGLGYDAKIVFVNRETGEEL